MTTPATKIVIVSGQEFSVPGETDNEAIRQQLVSMGFADVASATVQTGTKKVGDETVPTVEFVKKAGTKGLDAAELAALLGRVPRAEPLPRRVAGPAASGPALLRRLITGRLTLGQLVAEQQQIAAALEAAALEAVVRESRPTTTEGATLCTRLATLPADAAPRVVSGW